MPDPDEERHLLAIIMNGLWKAGKKALRDASEKPAATYDPAQRKIAEAVAEALKTHYDIVRKPGPDTLPSAHTRFTSRAE